MTLSTLTARVVYPWAGSSGPFAVPFRIQSRDDLRVVRVAASGATTLLTYGTHYTLTGVGDATAAVTLTAIGALPFVTGDSLLVRRSVTLTQPVSIRNQGSYFATTHEDEFDRIVMQLQTIQDQVDRCFQLGESDTTPSVTLPDPEANKLLAWNSAADALENVALDSTADVLVPGGGRTVDNLTDYLLNNAVFHVDDFGAVPDAKKTDTATCTIGSDVLTLSGAVGEPTFTAADIGKVIAIEGGAGSTWSVLTTTIAAYLGANSVQLTDAATSSKAATRVVWGTDSRAAIQAALDAVPTAGGLVVGTGDYIAKGTGTSTLTLSRDRTTMRSMGGRFGIFATRRDTRLVNTNEKVRCTIDGLYLVGIGKDVGTGTSSGIGTIATTTNSLYTSIINNYIEKAGGTGIVDDGSITLMLGNVIHTTGEHGVYMSSPQYSRFIGNFIFQAGKDTILTPDTGVFGIKADGVQRCVISQNVVVNAQGQAFNLSGTTNHNTITGNVFYHQSVLGDCVSLSGGTSVENIFSNNTIYFGNGQANRVGIDLNACYRCRIQGNILVLGNGPASTVALKLEDPGTTGNIIVGNTFVAETQTYANFCIINASILNNLFTDNYVLGASGGSFTTGFEIGGAAEGNRFLRNIMPGVTGVKYSRGGAALPRGTIVEDDDYVAKVQTTDATKTDLFAITLEALTTFAFIAEVIGRTSDGANNAFYREVVMAKNNPSALVGASTADVEIESDAAWDCNWETDGGDGVALRVTGKAATTINWRCKIRQIKVA